VFILYNLVDEFSRFILVTIHVFKKNELCASMMVFRVSVSDLLDPYCPVVHTRYNLYSFTHVSFILNYPAVWNVVMEQEMSLEYMV